MAVARNESGKAVVAYQRDFIEADRVYVNYYNGQNWSVPFQVSEQNATHPEVAISDNGDAIVVWAENGYIYAKIYKNGSWSQNYQIAGRYEGIDEEDFSVAMYPNGDAIVVWSTGSKIMKRIYNSANKTWQDPATIYSVTSEYETVSYPFVAIDRTASPSPIADFVWQHASINFQEILFSNDNSINPIVVWKKDFDLPSQIFYYLKPTSFMIACDVIIGIHYMEVKFDPPHYTIKTQAYASINPTGSTEPTAISNLRTTTASSFNPNNIPAPMVYPPLVTMNNECNAIGVWQEVEGSGPWQDHVWLNVYKNDSWQGPKRITEIDTNNDYLASYDP